MPAILFLLTSLFCATTASAVTWRLDCVTQAEDMPALTARCAAARGTMVDVEPCCVVRVFRSVADVLDAQARARGQIPVWP